METGEARRGNSRSRIKRVARLRRWLLGGIAVLLLVLAGLLGYARYRAHRFLADIPRRLGIDVKSETNGFTLSQSSKGHTLFTVHAAKAIQRANGKTTLHDVAITLYGPQGSHRTDSIRGDEFEYDQPNGVARALGDVHLDLAAPAPNGAAPKANAKRIAVTTRGLVFLQKLGVAATDEPIQILYGDLRGGAIGADYESDTGVLRLRKEVKLDGVQDGEQIHVDAAAAELDRTAQLATLHSAHVRAGGNTSSGDRMVFALAKDGGIQAVDAEGNVSLQGERGLHAAAPRLHVRVTDAGKPQAATMGGGVRLQSGNDTASATDVTVRFSSAGRPEQVDLQHAVRMDSPGSAGAAHSTLNAGRVVALLLQNGRRTELRDAVASGGAQLRSVEAVSTSQPSKASSVSSGKKASTRTTVLVAGTLHATTAVAHGERYVSAFDGSGDTRIDKSDDLGNTRSSSGDMLQATLLPQARVPARTKDAERASGAGVLRTAVQTGHVLITQHTVPAGTVAGKGDGPQRSQDSLATAQRAEYDGATQRLILTGSPLVTAPGVQLAADRILLLQGTGDAEAQGAVRGTLVQDSAAGKGDAVHVIADHATMAGSGGSARFSGGGKPVRLWTSAAQLQAAEVDLDRTTGTLAAHSAAGGMGTVQLFLPAAGKPVAAAGKVESTRPGGTLQVSCREMLMTGATAREPGHIDFSDNVHLVSAGSDTRANHVVATLKAAAKSDAAQAKSPMSAMSGGSIDTILATGDVHLRQPGRTATGERLLYTESESRYQLSGTPAAPPSITDSLRGSITGTTLIFHGGDDSVEVAGDTGHRVHTETQAARPTRSR